MTRESRPAANRTAEISTAAKNTHSVRRYAVMLVEQAVLTIKGPVTVALRSAGYRYVWSGSAGGAMLDRWHDGADRLPDVLAMLEHDGFRVRLVDVSPAVRTPTPAAVTVQPEPELQDPLW